MQTYIGDITELKPNEYALAPTNRQGRHGRGFARWMMNHGGLVYGHASGPCGQAYGVITKDLTKKIHPSVSEKEIFFQLIHFYEWAYWSERQKHARIYIPYKAGSTLLSGYTVEQMAKLFACVSQIPDNVFFEEGFGKLVQGFQ